MLLPPNLFLLIHMVWNPCHLNLIMVSLLLLKCQGPSYRRPDGKINISLLFRPSIIRGPWINTKIMLIRWFAALSRYYFSLLVWIFYLYYINHSIIHTIRLTSIPFHLSICSSHSSSQSNSKNSNSYTSHNSFLQKFTKSSKKFHQFTKFKSAL